MGHVRLKRLPATRKWRQVVALLADGAALDAIAARSAEAAEGALRAARADPAVAHALWLLTQIPLAARAPDFGEAARKIGLRIGSQPSLLEIIAAFSDAVDGASFKTSGRTDLGEMARMAAAESLTAVAGADLPSLCGESAADVRLALGKLAAPDRFARLARRLMRAILFYLGARDPARASTARRKSRARLSALPTAKALAWIS